MDYADRKKYLKRAIELARESVEKGGFPAGALIVKDGKIIAEGLSLGNLINDPTAHAETTSIREACKALKTTNLEGATLYASLQCCAMCFSAANWAGVSKIVTACRKTSNIVSKGYYEGFTSIQELNQLNTRKIELDYILEFEEEVLQLIRDWEKKQGIA
jgi:guanine deaminase